jgi:hypothetical protein
VMGVERLRVADAAIMPNVAPHPTRMTERCSVLTDGVCSMAAFKGPTRGP